MFKSVNFELPELIYYNTTHDAEMSDYVITVSDDMVPKVARYVERDGCNGRWENVWGIEVSVKYWVDFPAEYWEKLKTVDD